MPKKSFTLDLNGSCYNMPSLKDGVIAIEYYIEQRISFYENTNEQVYPSPTYKIKVVLEKINDN